MKVCVLGAGVAGMTSAYFLARDGHDVTVVERNAGVGLETSYANGGQLSAKHFGAGLAGTNAISCRRVRREPGRRFADPCSPDSTITG